MNIEVKVFNQTLTIGINESVLEACERSGIIIPNSCRVGVCHFCLLKIVKGKVPSLAQNGLDQELKDSGYFKSCVCFPKEPITCIDVHAAEYRGPIRILSTLKLGDDVLKIKFKKPNGFVYSPGQYFSLKANNQRMYNFSITSALYSHPDHVTIHTRIKNKLNSGNKATMNFTPGSSLWMEGPTGNYVLKNVDSKKNLLIVGSGTGVFTLYAVLMDAIQNKFRGKITFIHAETTWRKDFLNDGLQSLCLDHGITVEKKIIEKTLNSILHVSDLRKIALNLNFTPRNTHIIVCAEDGLVRVVKQPFPSM